MVYNCINNSAYYNLDYFSLDMFDCAKLALEGRLDPFGAAGTAAADPYDFWVFNWHFITMAPHLDLASIGRLPGLKFCILLELEPGNPLRHVALDVFDGYIALDPTTLATGKIFPFPRPLEGEPRRFPHVPRDVPIISSFGFGTPGKGFELVVDAVNREFERAIVRVNVPQGAYTSSSDDIHGKDYPRSLASVCERIAKPGIEVRFTFDFMTPENLLDWCSESDLNCFLYTRRQSGLSATTDQAIMSGRPLLTGTNDTFRHIHHYIPPYPVMSLRQAMETSAPLVRRIQDDWSRESFRRTFERMLMTFGSITLGEAEKTAPALWNNHPTKVLVASIRNVNRGDLRAFETRLADSLDRSGSYEISRAHCRDIRDLRRSVLSQKPWAVILVDFPYDAVGLARAVATVAGPKILLRDDCGGEIRHVDGLTIAPRRPIVPYYTTFVGLRHGRRVWLIGFAAASSNLEEVVAKLGRELGQAEILLEAPPAERAALEARIASLSEIDDESELWFTIAALPRRGSDVVELLAGDSLIVVFNDPARSDELESVSCLAMATERAVVFTRAAPFPRFLGGGSHIEDFSFPDLIDKGVQANINLLSDFGEWRTFANIERLFFEDRFESASQEISWDELLALDDASFIAAAYRALLGREADPEGTTFQLGRLAANVSRPGLLGEIFFSAEGLVHLAERIGPVTPLDSVLSLEGEAFVRGAYRFFLGREPDDGGFAYMTGRLGEGTSKLALAGEMLLSVEGRARLERRTAHTIDLDRLATLEGADFVAAAYRSIVERAADPEGLAYFSGYLNSGLSKTVVIGSLLLSDEGLARMSEWTEAPAEVERLSGGEGEEFISAAYRSFFGREPDEGGRTHFLKRLEDGVSKVEVAAELLLSPESLAYRSRPLVDDISDLAEASLDVDPAMGVEWGQLQTSEGEDFVHRAHWTILGRSPTVEEFLRFSDRLNRGEAKTALVGELMLSQEGFARMEEERPEFALGLNELASESVRFVCSAYRNLLGRAAERDAQLHNSARLENGLRQTEFVGELLLSLEGSAFVSRLPRSEAAPGGVEWGALPGSEGENLGHSAYWRILGRSPTPEELHRFIGRLHQGETKAALVGELLLSEECLSRIEREPDLTTRLRLLTASDDDRFIDGAYHNVLGRAPEPGALTDNCSRLNRGLSRTGLVGELLLSAESLVFVSRFPRKWRPQKKAKTATRGRVEMSLPSAEFLEESPTDPVEWGDLPTKEGADFIRHLYRRILGRGPAREEFDDYLGRLRQGESKAALAGRLLLSPQGLAQTEQIRPDVAARLRELSEPDNARFIEVVYRSLLGRAPEQQALTHNCDRLGLGLSRNEIVGEVLMSREGIAFLSKPSLLETATDESSKKPAAPEPIILRETQKERRLFVLVGVSSGETATPQRLALGLGRQLLALHESVRFVIWSPEARKFRLLFRDELNGLEWTESSARRLSVHPSRGERHIVLDETSSSDGDWLLVPHAVRVKPDIAHLYEMNIIIEARRLGLRTGFVFHGAEPLRRGSCAGDEAEAHELYMQALLLADLVVPVSTLAENDLISFFVQHQRAAFAPLIRKIPLLVKDDDLFTDEKGQQDYARRFLGLLSEVTDSHFPVASLYLCLGSAILREETLSGFARSLARALRDRGIDLIPAVWDAAGKRLVEPETQALARWDRGAQPDDRTTWIEPKSADAPCWVLSLLDLGDEPAREMAAYCRGIGLRLVALLPEAEEEAEAKGHFETLVEFDKVLAMSERSLDQFYRFLLSWPNKLVCAEDRFKALPSPNEILGLPRRGAPKKAMQPRFRVLAVESADRQIGVEILAEAAAKAAERSSAPLTLTVASMSQSGASSAPRGAAGVEFRLETNIDESKLDRLIDDADIVVCPDPKGVLSPVVVRSLWSGVPCIVVTRDPRERSARGLIFVASDDPTALSNAIERLTDEQWRNCLAREALGQPVRSWATYARDILTELAADRAIDSLRKLDKRPTRDIYATLANLRRRPKLSICISTYKRAGWIALNLRNLFTQIGAPRPDLEVVVVDNASPDDTPEAVRPYLGRSDFRYFRNPKNVGMLGNLAVTAQRARGEYFWILGDDDLTRDGVIDRVMGILNECPDISLIYMNYGYSSEQDPGSIADLQAYLDGYNVLEPAGPDEAAPVKRLAAKCENFFTAIYSHVYRRDHGIRSYCQDTSGRIFATMRACVPTAYYVLNYMADEPAYWIGTPSLVVNSNVSWAAYGPMLDLEHLPRSWDLAERVGCDPADVDRRRANRLWLVEMMWRDIFENDTVGNSAYCSAPRILMRLKHLKALSERIPEMRKIYEGAYAAGQFGALWKPEELFAAFEGR
ncbi:DUF4214 domain-containing protein [Methylocystis sp. JR02]|uniref:DUF4214 domain-containing protein n=1 Tax=Methylocystis sp. JR02 TaxID=3046284 RepID=UPI0024B92310|nr:DUF4214 domain-containing protein [Methylocystis sp. JR02]MDJ0447112.1 DUF4214 domain-containing protein [Methylocystis sp. JR02]